MRLGDVFGKSRHGLQRMMFWSEMACLANLPIPTGPGVARPYLLAVITLHRLAPRARRRCMTLPPPHLDPPQTWDEDTQGGFFRGWVVQGVLASHRSCLSIVDLVRGTFLLAAAGMSRFHPPRWSVGEQLPARRFRLQGPGGGIIRRWPSASQQCVPVLDSVGLKRLLTVAMLPFINIAHASFGCNRVDRIGLQ